MPFTGPSRGPQILAGNIIPMIFATVFTVARLWSRAIILKVWGLDDTFVVVSWLVVLALIVANCVAVRFGQGHHNIDIPTRNLVSLSKIAYCTQLFYASSLSLIKISICLFYLRLFTDRLSKCLIWGTVILIASWTIPCVVLTIFQCNPVRGVWDTSIGAKCIDTEPIFWTLGVMNIVVDIWLIALVVEKVRRLQLAKKQKIALLSIVTMGWLVVIAALVRIARILRVIDDVKAGTDSSWVAYDTSIWSAVEVCVGLFCVTAPTIKPFLRRYAPNMMSFLKSSVYGGTYGTYTSAHRTRVIRGDDIELNNRDTTPIIDKKLRPGTQKTTVTER